MRESDSKLVRAWSRQLVAEYRQLCWLYRLPLRVPVFEISDGLKTAGCWKPGFDTLQMASWLITEHSWDVVLEVLKHEMAHQYVHQILARHKETPHGPAFQEACERLGVHPRFRRATTAIPRLVPGPDRAAADGMLARVEKLFALAESANEHEATLAMQKANALLRRHNLERLAATDGGRYEYLILNEKKKRLAAHQRLLAALLKDFFYVNVVISRQFDAATAETHRVIELTGRQENLAVAEHVYSFLGNRLTVLWRRYQKANRAPGRERSSYYLGVLNGLREKLAREESAVMRKEGSFATSALICAGDPGLIRFCRSRYPRLRNVKHAGTQVHAGTFEAGKAEGRQLVIHKGVGGSAGNKGRRLPRG